MTKKAFRQKADAVLMHLNMEVLPFVDDREESQGERLRRAEADPLYFCRTYLPHYFNVPPARFHRELIQLLEQRPMGPVSGGTSAAPQTWEALKPVVVAAPREFAKTTVCSFGYVLHQICFGKRHFIIIGSDTEDLASDLTGYLFLELLYNDRLRQDFGTLVTGAKAVDDFVTTNDVRVKARGRGQRLRGLKHRQWRPDLVILDDLENDVNVRNPEIVQQILAWITSAVYPAMEANGNLFIIGTILRRRSALDIMLTSEEEPYCHFTRRIYRAITPDGGSLWEVKHPVARLLRQKQLMGTVAFNCEKMNEPVQDAGIFRQEWIRYYHPDSLKDKELRVAVFFDPSLESGATADYKAVVTVGLAVQEMVFYVLDAFLQKTTLEQALLTVCNRFREYRPQIIGVEDNFFQRLLLHEVERLGREQGMALPIRGVTHRVSKEARISALSPLLERAKIRFIRGHSDQEMLIEQLLYFPSRTIHDDGPDALEGAIRLLQAVGGTEVDYRSAQGRRFEGRGAY
ncbi:MAG: phage terminase large subunit [Desulfobacca sp.]|uniref:phage terminase large subunit n=1 Tax=Desulfobacca sp. TaxID=2067990 RepID=UPI00404ABB03